MFVTTIITLLSLLIWFNLEKKSFSWDNLYRKPKLAFSHRSFASAWQALVLEDCDNTVNRNLIFLKNNQRTFMYFQFFPLFVVFLSLYIVITYFKSRLLSINNFILESLRSDLESTCRQTTTERKTNTRRHKPNLSTREAEKRWALEVPGLQSMILYQKTEWKRKEKRLRKMSGCCTGLPWAPGKGRQEDQEFRVIFCYILSWWLARVQVTSWGTKKNKRIGTTTSG